MKKILKTFLLILMATCCCVLFTSCAPKEQPLYVVSVEQNEERSTSAYVVLDIKYSDNSTETVTLRNGTDGTSSITPITFSDAFSFYCEFNQLEETSDNLHTFITEFINLDADAIITNNIKKSVVSIYSEFVAVYEYSNFPFAAQSETCYNVGSGAGVIYKIDADSTYILTNFHVVFDAEESLSFSSSLTYQGLANRIFIYQYGTNPKNFISNSHSKGVSEYYTGLYSFGGRAIQADFVGGSYLYDLALIKVPTSALENWTTETPLANNYDEGEKVYAVGNPFGYGISSTDGSISYRSELISFSGENFSHRVLRTSAAINGGNSGGGLFDAAGKLVGIVNAKTNSSSVDNVGYAIPIDIVKKVAENILTNAGKRGLQTLTLTKTSIIDSYAEVDALNMLKIHETIAITNDVEAESMEAKLGLQKNDILVEMVIVRNGQETSYTINQNAEFNENLLNLRVGDYLYYKVKRDNNVVDLKDNKQQITSATLTYPKEDKELFDEYLD